MPTKMCAKVSQVEYKKIKIKKKEPSLQRAREIYLKAEKDKLVKNLRIF